MDTPPSGSGRPVPSRELPIRNVEFDRQVSRVMFQLRGLARHDDEEGDRVWRPQPEGAEWNAEFDHPSDRGSQTRAVDFTPLIPGPHEQPGRRDAFLELDAEARPHRLHETDGQ